MKIIPLVLFFLGFAAAVAAQSSVQQKNDSVCLLIKKYFNEQSDGKLYGLVSDSMQQQLDPGKFKDIAQKNLFPLGGMKATVFEKIAAGVSYYKAVFPSTSLLLLVGVDSAGKLRTFFFQPYKDEKAVKDYPVPFSNPLATALDKAVDTIAGAYIRQLNTVGLSIGVLKEGKTYFYGYGETAKGNKTIPGAATIFEIGSVSKTFTATLLAIAVGEGRVKLDDPVNKYLPDSIPLLQYNKRVVTLRELSNHTSAIPRMPSNFESTVVNLKDPYSNYTVGNLYAFLRHLQLTREPGKAYEYSNTAVGLLGTILQNIYQQSYEALIVKYICTPLGMNNTRVAIRKGDSSLVAKGYDENGTYNVPWNLAAAFAGAGAIRSTTRDMLKYAEANTGKASGALGKAIQLTHDTTYSGSGTRIGLGWHYIQSGNAIVLFHNGATGGYRAFLASDTQKKMAVVMLTNSAIAPDEAGNALVKWLEKN